MPGHQHGVGGDRFELLPECKKALPTASTAIRQPFGRNELLLQERAQRPQRIEREHSAVIPKALQLANAFESRLFHPSQVAHCIRCRILISVDRPSTQTGSILELPQTNEACRVACMHLVGGDTLGYNRTSADDRPFSDLDGGADDRTSAHRCSLLDVDRSELNRRPDGQL